MSSLGTSLPSVVSRRTRRWKAVRVAIFISATLSIALPDEIRAEVGTCTRHSEIAIAIDQLMASSGAINVYFDPERARRNLIEPYAGNFMLIDMLRVAPNSPAQEAARRWLDWQFDRQNTYFDAERLVIHFADGSGMAVPKGYRRNPDDLGEPLTPYTEEELVRLRANLAILHMRGSSYKFYTDPNGREVPYWIMAAPYLAGNSLSVKPTAENAQRYAYDSTDSYAATTLTLSFLHMQGLDDRRRAAFLARRFDALVAYAEASVATLDSSTGLTRAAPFAMGEYTLDNVEVWAGLRDFIAMMTAARDADVRVVDASAAIARFSATADALRDAISMRLQPDDSDRHALAGYNGETNLPLWDPARGVRDVQWYDASLGLIRNRFPTMADPDARQRVFLSFRRHHALAPSQAVIGSPPSLWRTTTFADDPDIDGGASRLEAMKLGERICEIFIVRGRRDWRFWSALEEGAFLHLLPAE